MTLAHRYVRVVGDGVEEIMVAAVWDGMVYVKGADRASLTLTISAVRIATQLFETELSPPLTVV